MSENSKIEWCDHTCNPWEGCTKVSAGCAHCYAEARNNRFKGGNWGKGKPRRRTSAANWNLPIKWNRKPLVCDSCGRNESSRDRAADPICGECGGHMHRARVFCASLGDWLDDEVPIEWLADLLALIHATPNLDWLLLTKRPENFQERIKSVLLHVVVPGKPVSETLAPFLDWLPKWRHGVKAPANIWLGTSVENQAMADKRIPKLLEIPAKVRFLSVEPMLGPIDFQGNRFFDFDQMEPTGQFRTNPLTGKRQMAMRLKAGEQPRIHWSIFGGESGPGARPCNVEWIRDGVKQCQAAGVKAFVKQLGAQPFWRAEECLEIKHPKGGDPAEWPEDLRVREFPEVPRD